MTTLAEKISTIAYLKGSFRLRSGRTASYYFDKFALYSDPNLLAETANEMVALIPAETEVLAGPALGGVPLVTAVSLASKLPAVSVRGSRKKYGTERIVEGCSVAGRNVCIVEDVVSTGGAAINAAAALRAEGARVNSILCIIYRGEGAPQKLTEAGLAISSLFQGTDIPEPS